VTEDVKFPFDNVIVFVVFAGSSVLAVLVVTFVVQLITLLFPEVPPVPVSVTKAVCAPLGSAAELKFQSKEELTVATPAAILSIVTLIVSPDLFPVPLSVATVVVTVELEPVVVPWLLAPRARGTAMPCE
jgi:hypothetical protein